MTEEFDSIRAAQRLTRSARLRAFTVSAWAIIAMVWKIAGPFVYGGVGWIAGRVAIAEEIVQMQIALRENTRAIAELAHQVAEDRSQDQRDRFAIGRQAAYATAGFQAYEPAKLRDQKRAYAANYAASFERIARKKGSEVAMADLFDGALP